MLYLPIAIISVAILALFFSTEPPGIDDPLGVDMRAVYLAILAVALALYGVGRMLATGGYRTVRGVAIWFGLVSGLATAFVLREEAAAVIEEIRAELRPSVALSRSLGEAELRRAWDGHYRAAAEVNGVPVKLMIDTGASMVLIPYEEAEALGIDVAQLDFSLPVTTANGRAAVAPVTLSSIKIGPIAVFEVPAAVAQPGRLRMGLLGMSFLDRLDEVSFQGERLLLRKRDLAGEEQRRSVLRP